MTPPTRFFDIGNKAGMDSNEDGSNTSNRGRAKKSGIPVTAVTAPFADKRGTKVHDTTAGLEDLTLKPIISNTTLSEGADKTKVSSTEANVSLVNDLRMETKENVAQMQISIDGISNMSGFRNYTIYVNEN
jgi:hypothetical protein